MGLRSWNAASFIVPTLLFLYWNFGSTQKILEECFGEFQLKWLEFLCRMHILSRFKRPNLGLLRSSGVWKLDNMYHSFTAYPFIDHLKLNFCIDLIPYSHYIFQYKHLSHVKTSLITCVLYYKGKRNYCILCCSKTYTVCILQHKLAYFISMFSILARCCKGSQKKLSHLNRWLLSSWSVWAAVISISMYPV